jgi:sugar lactone lactonase YvrE
MTSKPATRSFRAVTALSLLVLAGAITMGCTEHMDDGMLAPVPDRPTACGASGVGSIAINVSGLPADALAKVKVTGPGGASDVSASRTIADAAGGSYDVAAERVVTADPIVRTVYEAKVSVATFCLAGAETKTVDVAYAPVATSNKLWMTNANNESGELQGFASAVLGATGSPASSVAAKAPAKAVAFDKDGNVWTLGSTSADAPVGRFAAADLGTPGAKTPDRSPTTAPSCAPGYTDLAFDPTGNLWISSGCGNEVMRLTPAQLEAHGDAVPAVKIGGLGSPAGIAFDATGNLWVADQDAKRVLRYDASRLAASSSDPASLSIDPRTPSSGDLAPSNLAFDKDGNLWATSFGGNVIYKLTPAELAGTGEHMLTPSVQITVDVGALLEGIAFDESGSLWLTYSAGKVARLASTQLGASSTAGAPTAPQTILSSANIGSAGALAFYPAPAALPLFSKLP